MPGPSKAIEFDQLSSTRLPYGKPVTISGQFSKLKIKVGEREKYLTDYIHVSAVSLKYTVSGLPEVSKEGTLDRNNWIVVTDKLPENATVVFFFQFSGQLKAEKIEELFDKLVTDQRYDLAVRTVLAGAAVGDLAKRVEARQRFLEDLTPILQSQLPPSLRAAAKNVTTVTLAAPLANLRPRIEDLAKITVRGVQKNMKPSEANKKVQEFVRQKCPKAPYPRPLLGIC